MQHFLESVRLNDKVNIKKSNTVTSYILYSYWLGLMTAAVLFDQRTKLSPEAAGWGQQICSRVNLNCCSWSQSITVLLYTFIFFKIFLFSLSTLVSITCFQYSGLSSPRIWTTPLHCDINITGLIETLKIRPSVNSYDSGQ